MLECGGAAHGSDMLNDWKGNASECNSIAWLLHDLYIRPEHETFLQSPLAFSTVAFSKCSSGCNVAVNVVETQSADEIKHSNNLRTLTQDVSRTLAMWQKNVADSYSIRNPRAVFSKCSSPSCFHFTCDQTLASHSEFMRNKHAALAQVGCRAPRHHDSCLRALPRPVASLGNLSI